MPNSVIVGKLRAIQPGHIILGGNVLILLPAHISIDGLEVGTSLTVVVHQEDEQLVVESVRKTGFLVGNLVSDLHRQPMIHRWPAGAARSCQGAGSA